MATRTSRLSEFLFGKEKKTFLEDIEGVLKIGKIFGCTFFGFTEKWKAGNFVYAIPLYTVYVWCIPTAGEFYKNTFFNKTMVLFFTELIYFIANITVTLSRPFYYLLARKRYKNLLWELNKLFFNLRNGYRLRYKRDFKLFHFYLILLIKMIIYILQRLYTVVGTLSVETQIIFLGGMFFCSADDFVDYSILKHIRRVFRLINEEIERYETPNGGRPIEYDTRTIGYYISIHRKATKLARHFNLLVSPSIVGSIALHVSVVVMLVHYSTVSLYAFWNGTDADINFIVLSNVCIFEISSKFCAMITIWPDVEKEAHKTATHIHDIWNHLASNDDINRRTKHLQLIALQLYNNKLSFTAYGFFALDWTLLQRIIAAVTTYVVILIQFEISSGAKNLYANTTMET